MNAHLPLNQQYRSFVDALKQSMLDPSKPYVKKQADNSCLYTFDNAKDRFFRTQQITAISHECLNFFSPDACEESLPIRIAVLSDLHCSLVTCASRIEDSIKRRWWYSLVHLFGYQAKCPAGIQNLLKELNNDIERLQCEQKAQEQEAEADEENRLKLDTSSQKPQDNQSPPSPPEEQAGDPQKSNPQSLKMDPVESAIDTFDFDELHNNIKTSIYNFLSCKELAKMREVSSSLKKSIDDYLAHPKLLLKLMIELVDLKNNAYQARADKYQVCLDLILQYDKLEVTFQQDADFKVSLLDHLTSTPEVLIWNKDPNSIRNLINFFFEYASESQWNTFIQFSLTNFASVPIQEIFHQQYGDNYHTCLDLILQHPQLKELLNKHVPFKVSLFDHLTSSQRQDIIDWNKKDPKDLQTVIDLFFEYASDAQLSTFIQQETCSMKKDETGWDRYQLKFPNFTNLFLKNLTSERIDRLVKLPQLPLFENYILMACALIKGSLRTSYVSIIESWRQKLPNSDCWNQIKNDSSRDYSQLMYLRSIVVGLEIVELIKKPFNPLFSSEETQISNLADQVRNLINHFNHERGRYEAEETLSLIFHSLESIETPKLIALTRAFVIIPKGAYSYRFEFMKRVLKKDSNFFDPLLREFIKLNCNSEFPDEGLKIFEKFTKKEHVEIFIQVSKDMPEPMKTIHLRALASSSLASGNSWNTFEESPFKEIEPVFKEAGLEFSHYPLMSRDLFGKVFRDLEYFTNLKTINSADELKKCILKKIKERYLGNYFSVLHSLAGGIELAPGNILKISLDQEKIKQVFKNFGFSFKHYNQAITLEDFFKKEKDRFNLNSSEKLEEQ